MTMFSLAFFLLTVTLFCKCGKSEPTFKLVTAYNRQGLILKPENIEKTSVYVLKPIIFIINGIDEADSVGDGWYKGLMDGYLEKQIHNVFIVDWKFDSNQIQSTAFSVASFIKVLFDKTGESYLDIHLVGVLAGSQVASVAGERVAELTGRKVNRITALDPTYYLINDENRARVDEDANFVDVVHSNLSGFNDKLGDVRFYLYSSKCEDKDFGKLEAVKLFADSINSDKFKGVKCGSFEDFKAGKCEKNETVIFGENVDRNARGNYFVAAC